jgi:MoxR-like ATPase
MTTTLLDPTHINKVEHPDRWLESVIANIAAGTDWAKANIPDVRKASKTPTSPLATATSTVVLSDGKKVIDRPNGQQYHVRKWGGHDDVSVLRQGREKGLPILLYGEPGCGKTALIEAAFGEETFTILGHGDIEVADFQGSWVPVEGTNEFVWQDGPLFRAMETGSVLVIDEVGVIDTKVLTSVYSVMDGRGEVQCTLNPKRGTVVAAPGFYVVAATNPNAPGVNLSEALLSRFVLQAEMTTDWTLARKLNVPAIFTQIAQNLERKRRNSENASEVSWSPQMRDLLAARDTMEAFGEEFALANLVATAPEIDRPVVLKVISQMTGRTTLQAAKI